MQKVELGLEPKKSSGPGSTFPTPRSWQCFIRKAGAKWKKSGEDLLESEVMRVLIQHLLHWNSPTGTRSEVPFMKMTWSSLYHALGTWLRISLPTDLTTQLVRTFDGHERRRDQLKIKLRSEPTLHRAERRKKSDVKIIIMQQRFFFCFWR